MTEICCFAQDSIRNMLIWFLCLHSTVVIRPLTLQSNSSSLIVFWNNLRDWLPDNLQGQSWTFQPDKGLVKILSAHKSVNKLRTAVSQFQRSSPTLPVHWTSILITICCTKSCKFQDAIVCLLTRMPGPLILSSALRLICCLRPAEVICGICQLYSIPVQGLQARQGSRGSYQWPAQVISDHLHLWQMPDVKSFLTAAIQYPSSIHK